MNRFQILNGEEPLALPDLPVNKYYYGFDIGRGFSPTVIAVCHRDGSDSKTKFDHIESRSIATGTNFYHEIIVWFNSLTTSYPVEKGLLGQFHGIPFTTRLEALGLNSIKNIFLSAEKYTVLKNSFNRALNENYVDIPWLDYLPKHIEEAVYLSYHSLFLDYLLSNPSLRISNV